MLDMKLKLKFENVSPQAFDVMNGNDAAVFLVLPDSVPCWEVGMLL